MYKNYNCTMNKKFNAEDKIELGLYHKVAEYYYLKYRFLPKKVRIHILFFYITVTVKDPWHVIRLYESTGIPEVNPDNESLWKPVRIDVLDCSDIQRYNALKKEINTYRDLDETFKLTLRQKRYELDKSFYKW